MCCRKGSWGRWTYCCAWWDDPGGGYGTAGAQDDLALVEVGVRCSLEQVQPQLLHMAPVLLHVNAALPSSDDTSG